MSSPFMQLYVGDYLRDTQGLTTEGHGAYLLILFAMWNADGWVSADPRKMAQYARMTPARWAKIAPDILPLLTLEDGLATQKRLLRELEKASGKSLKRSQAGKLGAQAKALKNNKVPQANAEANATANASANGDAMVKHSPETRNQKPEDTSSLRSDVCSEAPAPSEPVSNVVLLPEGLRRTPGPPAFIALPTNRKDENFIITEQHVAEFLELYPAADVVQELRSMRGWLIANPTKRKTKTGMLRFVNGWLAKQQNKGFSNGQTRRSATNKNDNFLLGIGAAIAETTGSRSPESNGDWDTDRETRLALLPP